jgi:hypothetical protein
MVDFREHAQRFLYRADHIVHIGFHQEHCAMVVGMLGKLAYDFAAFFPAFLAFVSGMVHPVAVGGKGAGLGYDIGRSEILRMREDFFQIVVAPLAFGLVGMDDVGIGGNAGNRQVVITESIADRRAFRLGDLARPKFHAFEVQV